jgi:hypothetical protein
MEDTGRYHTTGIQKDGIFSTENRKNQPTRLGVRQRTLVAVRYKLYCTRYTLPVHPELDLLLYSKCVISYHKIFVSSGIVSSVIGNISKQ